MGRLLHICVSERKGITKTEVASARFEAAHGIIGDAHAGPGERQISLLAREDIDTMRAQGLELEAGAFGENLVVEDLSLCTLPIGAILSMGDVRLRITRIGKVCHRRCAIYFQTGDCIMPRRGVFAEVLQGGSIAAGATISIEEAGAREAVQPAQGASRAGYLR